MKHVKVLIGNYGSGKSELALNFAMQAAARGDRTELLDLDMVNTYFRLTEPPTLPAPVSRRSLSLPRCRPPLCWIGTPSYSM